MIHVSREQFQQIAKSIRQSAASRKEKREQKRESLPWSGNGNARRKRSTSLFKYWAARLDHLWSVAVRSRDRARYGDVCRIRRAKNCSGRNECAYHLISKARGHAIRWDPVAGVAACKACNLGEMMNRSLYAEYHDEIFGRYFMNELRFLAHRKVKYDVPGLKELAEKIMASLGYHTPAAPDDGERT